MKSIMQTIHAIAPTDSNVVILGESGTGKDMMAKYIHEHSDRADKAFISINCAAIPDQLLESELFGYEAGAFSGALSNGDECTNLLQPLYLIPMLAVVNQKLKDVWGMCAFICVFWVIVIVSGYLIIPTLVPWTPGI